MREPIKNAKKKQKRKQKGKQKKAERLPRILPGETLPPFEINLQCQGRG